MSSNWNALQSRLEPVVVIKKRQKANAPHVKAGRSDGKHAAPAPAHKPVLKPAAQAASSSGHGAPVPKTPLSMKTFRAEESALTELLAIDCEMVGVGSAGTRSALAQVVVVNSREELVYSSYVKPREKVVDYRTHVSGIRPKHLVNAISFRQAQTEISRYYSCVGRVFTPGIACVAVPQSRAAPRASAV